jgi:hypothetical protein
MKDRLFAGSAVSLLAGAIILGTGNTDLLYVVVCIALFGIGVVYAEGCEKL